MFLLSGTIRTPRKLQHGRARTYAHTYSLCQKYVCYVACNRQAEGAISSNALGCEKTNPHIYPTYTEVRCVWSATKTTLHYRKAYTVKARSCLHTFDEGCITLPRTDTKIRTHSRAVSARIHMYAYVYYYYMYSAQRLKLATRSAWLLALVETSVGAGNTELMHCCMT